jgi:hypothetical protein
LEISFGINFKIAYIFRSDVRRLISRNNNTPKEHTTRLGSYCCVSTAEAAEAALCSPVEPEERENMYMKAVAHGLVLLIVHLQEQHIWVLFRKLANLQTEINLVTAQILSTHNRRTRLTAQQNYFRNK